MNWRCLSYHLAFSSRHAYVVARDLKSADTGILTHDGEASCTGKRFCHGKGGASMENAEILHSILIDRHLAKYGFIISRQKPDTKCMVHGSDQPRVEYITLFLCHLFIYNFPCTMYNLCTHTADCTLYITQVHKKFLHVHSVYSSHEDLRSLMSYSE